MKSFSAQPPKESPGAPREGDPAEGLHRWHRRALDLWRPVLLFLLCVELPLIVLNHFDLPGGISFGYRSFARNIGILGLLGVLLGARGLPWPRSSLTAPLLVFLGAAALSVVANGGRWGDVRGLGFAFGMFFFGCSLAWSPKGRLWLFHWLGLLVVFTLGVEVASNPEILQFRESLRHTVVTAHPNTLGAFFAVLAPVFVGTLDDRSARRLGPLYSICALIGVGVTFSRLAFAGLFLGSAAVVLASWSKRHPVRMLVLGVVTTLVVVGVIFALSQGRAEADWQRLRIMYTSLTLFAEHWPVGIGFGAENLEALFPDRYAALYGNSLWLYHSHNMYVDILVGTGLVGATAAAWFFYRLGTLAWKARFHSYAERHMRRIGSGLAATVVVFFLLGVGDMPLYHERLMFPLVMAWALLEGWVRSVQTRPS